MIILGIESSCDETGCAIALKENDRIKLLSNIVSSSQQIHVKYGGVVPEQAAREQIKSIIPVIQEALNQAQITIDQIDAIAVTYGPGLIGSLLVGVETAKTLSLLWKKPLIPINHLMAHFYAHWIDNPTPPSFPALGLLVSGGHTDLVLLKSHTDYEYLGGTRDDAAGECFDKCARLLELPYPGGPNLSKLAVNGNPKRFNLPIPMLNSKDLDFSFSGLKTAVLNTLNQDPGLDKADLAASVEETICQSLVIKVVQAIQKHNIDQVMVAGGVAANSNLRQKLSEAVTGKLFIPKVELCTDNGTVIATRAFFEEKRVDPLELQVDPSLSLQKQP